jgi:LysR family carnitine catabolism transcriptional activator
MKIQQLRAFIAVAQTLSFARASERLHLSQPALSLAIQSLEESLGGQLLSRTTRQVRVTPEGAAFLPLAEQLLADWENARENLRQRFTLQRGHLSLAAMPSFAGNELPRLLAAFRGRYPKVQVSVHDVVHEQVLHLVENGRVEMGFAFEPDADERLRFISLYSDRFIAVVPAESELATRPALIWEELLEQGFIALQRPSTVRRLLEGHLLERATLLRIAFECHQLATVGQMVAAGLGVSAVPALCAAQMRAFGAICLPLSGPVIERPVGIVARQGQELSAAATVMLETALSISRQH